MDEILKLALAHLAQFFRIFIQLAADPLRTPQRLELFNSRKLDEALIFFAVSVFVAVLVKISFIPDGVDHFLYASQDAIWKIILVISASLIARISWFSCSGTYVEYLVANCYFVGVLSIFVSIAFIILHQLPTSGMLTYSYHALLWFAILTWCLFAWFSYGRHNERPIASALGRLIIFGLFMPPLGVTNFLVRGGTVIAAAGYDYEAAYFTKILPSFGIFP